MNTAQFKTDICHCCGLKTVQSFFIFVLASNFLNKKIKVFHLFAAFLQLYQRGVISDEKLRMDPRPFKMAKTSVDAGWQGLQMMLKGNKDSE